MLSFKQSESAKKRSAPKLANAMGFLTKTLTDAGGSMKQPAIENEARNAGISERTLARAKKKLGVDAGKVGLTDGWTWTLP